MSERLLKTDSEAALDEVTASATELLELWASLEESGHAAALRQRIGSLLSTFDKELDALMNLRRNRGELPAIGNIERAQVDAAVVSFEKLLPGTDDRQITAEKLTQAGERIRSALDTALSCTDDERLLDSLRALCNVTDKFLAQLVV